MVVHMNAAGETDMRTLADKLGWLLKNLPDPDTGESMSIPRLGAKIRRLGYDYHDNTLRNVLSGKISNPQWRVIEGIARGFGVSTDLFRSDMTLSEWKRQRARQRVLAETDLGRLTDYAVGVPPGAVELALEVARVVLDRSRREQDLVASAQGVPATHPVQQAHETKRRAGPRRDLRAQRGASWSGTAGESEEHTSRENRAVAQ
jgi:hypothetical protein